MSQSEFRLSVHKYKAKLRKVFGFADPEMVKRYAVARSEYKAGIQSGRFNPFTNDPNCKNCKKKKTSTDDGWRSLMLCEQGKTAYIVGKGRTLKNWVNDKYMRCDNSIIISINDACDVVNCDYPITTHPKSITDRESYKSVVFTTKDNDQQEYIDKGWIYFTHTEDPKREFELLQLSRNEIMERRVLYAASSTAQNAVHLAWYMGCSRVVLVGIDGGGGYSSLTPKYTAGSDENYKMMRDDTIKELDVLFENKWRDLYCTLDTLTDTGKEKAL